MVLLHYSKEEFMWVLLKLGVISAFIIFVSCQKTTVQQDMDEYCDCIQKGDMAPCEELKIDIADKYAYDPEASAYIQERLSTCAQ